MISFKYNSSELFCENVNLKEIAKDFGTPSYVYSKKAIEENAKAYVNSFDNPKNLACFAVKSLSNISILKIIKDLGCGFDIVSGGELHRALSIGAEPQNIILSFNVESASELYNIERIAKKLSSSAPVSIRINPDIDSGGHDYITTGRKGDKFGISSIEEIFELCKYSSISQNLNLVGLACHIGSQILDLDGYVKSADKIFELSDQLSQEGIELDFLDLGGGLGVTYEDEAPPAPKELISSLEKKFSVRRERLILEPGRSISANTGVLLTKVEYIKDNFLIVDAAMNDLLRPALYKATHGVCNLDEKKENTKNWNIVGPVCESSDFLAKNVSIDAVEGDYIAIKNAGAYGFVMASNYNSRPRACEVLINNDKSSLIRKRETVDDLLEMEIIHD